MIYVTRHGQTNWNLEKKVMGRCDEPLNDNGKSQALETKNKLLDVGIDLIICSPLLRTKQTAEIINGNRNIPVIYDDRIIERDFGEFEGMQVDNFDFHGYWNYYKNEQYQKAENIQVFFKRVYCFLENIVINYSDKNIFIVAHVGVIFTVKCFFYNDKTYSSLTDSGLVFEI